MFLWREARASAPKAGFRQCVLGLEVHMPGDSLRGCQLVCAGEASHESPKTRFNPDSSISNVYPTAKSCDQVFLCGGKLRFRPQNQDSENVYLDSHLSVTDWGRMEVHIF